MVASIDDEKIMIDGRTYHLDYVKEGEPSLMIINGMTYLISKASLIHSSLLELKAPHNWQGSRYSHGCRNCK
ncbi:MAG: hypothetical protein WAL24_03045 [Nitrososphaeraceae archaeon]